MNHSHSELQDDYIEEYFEVTAPDITGLKSKVGNHVWEGVRLLAPFLGGPVGVAIGILIRNRALNRALTADERRAYVVGVAYGLVAQARGEPAPAPPSYYASNVKLRGNYIRGAAEGRKTTQSTDLRNSIRSLNPTQAVQALYTDLAARYICKIKNPIRFTGAGGGVECALAMNWARQLRWSNESLSTSMEVFFDIEDTPSTEWEHENAVSLTDPNEKTCAIPQSDLKVGDILLSTTDALLSRAIREETGAVYSHSRLYLGKGRVIDAGEAYNGSGTGVQITSVTRAIARDKYTVVCRPSDPLKNAERKRIRSIAFGLWKSDKAKPGKYKFDFVGMLVQGGLRIGERNTDKFYCSELVAYIYEKAGVPLPTDNRSSPGDLGNILRYAGHLKFSKESNLALQRAEIHRCMPS